MAAESVCCVGGEMTPTIGIRLTDGLADVYAFATLYDYLIEREFPANFVVGSDSAELIKKFRECTKTKLEYFLKPDELDKASDIKLSSYCDIRSDLNSLCDREIAIDHSILKNCMKPVNEEQRKLLRETYRIPADNPVIVVGFAYSACQEDLDSLKFIFNHVCNDTSIYLVGSLGNVIDEFIEYWRGLSSRNAMKFFDTKGVLKDYYAAADLTLMSSRCGLQNLKSPLHNFVEATAGGPLFLVEPNNKLQYGYKKLRDLGAIRESRNTEDLISKIKTYLQHTNGQELRKLRAEHLEKSREIYLNDIMKLLNKVLELSEELPDSNLLADIVKVRKGRFFYEKAPRIRIYHPETVWNPADIKKSISINKIPEKVYERFRRKK